MSSLPQHRMISNHIHQVHVADGFADDCEELIHRWLKTDMLTYETFCAIWKDMRFDLIYHGRSTGAEVGELSEEVLHIAKHYMVTNPDNFEEAVAGLFLVYGLLNTQPYPGFAPLRIVPEDVAAITRIETVARASQRYDVLYILGSILTQGPVQYQAVARERGMEASIRKYLEGTTGIDRVGVRPKGVFYRQNEELDLLRELNNITRRYVDAKKNIPGSSKSLSYINEKFATELDTSLKVIINGILEEGDEGNKKITDHYSTVQVIKEKAMRHTVDSVRFLQSAANRNAETSKSAATKLTSEVKRKPTKKVKSPPRAARRLKRRCTVGAHTYKNRKRTRTQSTRYSTSDSSEESLILSQDESQDSQSDSENNIEVRTNLNLDDLDGKTKRNQKAEKMIDIQIDSLPVLITTEQGGNMVEIEIIDQMNQPQSEVDTKIKQVNVSSNNQDALDETSEDSDDMLLSKLLDVKKESLNVKKTKNETRKKIC